AFSFPAHRQPCQLLLADDFVPARAFGKKVASGHRWSSGGPPEKIVFGLSFCWLTTVVTQMEYLPRRGWSKSYSVVSLSSQTGHATSQRVFPSASPPLLQRWIGGKGLGARRHRTMAARPPTETEAESQPGVDALRTVREAKAGCAQHR